MVTRVKMNGSYWINLCYINYKFYGSTDNYKMTTDSQNQIKVEFLYKELSYAIIGILITIHKELGPYAREKQYADAFEKILRAKNISFVREQRVADSGNILDFIVDEKIVVEFKAVPFLINEHYDQVKRYLHQTQLKLGILVNFRDQRIKPKRILNINNLRNTDSL